MTNEERDLISRFIARIGGQPQASGGFMTSSVPATTPTLPPIDREADAFIAEQFQRYPEAKYRMTQTALVQEAALAEAQNAVQRLQWELEQARHAAQQAPRQAENKGFFGSLFGGGATPQPQQQMQRPMPQGAPQQGPWGGQQGGYPQGGPPQPQYAPNYQPGMFQRGGGSGFLGSALTTAAGVAGGMVVGNALMNAFGGHGGGGSSWSNTASSGSTFDNAGFSPSDPTAGFVTDSGYSDPFAGGGSEKDFGGGSFDTNTSWDQAGSDAGSFDSGGSLDSGGSFDSGGGFDDNP